MPKKVDYILTIVDVVLIINVSEDTIKSIHVTSKKNNTYNNYSEAVNDFKIILPQHFNMEEIKQILSSAADQVNPYAAAVSLRELQEYFNLFEIEYDSTKLGLDDSTKLGLKDLQSTHTGLIEI